MYLNNNNCHIKPICTFLNKINSNNNNMYIILLLYYITAGCLVYTSGVLGVFTIMKCLP